MEEEIMTIKDVAAFLKLSEGAIRRYARMGSLPGKFIGRVWRFKKSEVMKWFDEYGQVEQ